MTAAAAAGLRLDWQAAALQPRLQAVLPGLALEVRATAGSTNTVLLERLRERAAVAPGRPVPPDGARAAPPAEGRLGAPGEDPAPCLLVAEHQTAGRGRLGRDWQSACGASLTFSLALPLAPADFSGLSLAVGLAVAEALDAAEPPLLWLKWPNDLWLHDAVRGGRKLGGILIETVQAGDRRWVVVGIGLNVQPQPAPPGAPYGLASVQELKAGVTAPGVLAQVAVPLLQALLRFERDGFGPVAAAYARRDLLRGRRVTTTLSEVPEGEADGVDATGSLRVRASGRVHRVASGEVSVRLQPAGSA